MKLITGVQEDAGEQRRGEQDGDLVGVKLPPIEPDREIWQIAAHHQEQGGIEKTEAPSEGQAPNARQRLLHGG
jgi:hypothetical protein